MTTTRTSPTRPAPTMDQRLAGDNAGPPAPPPSVRRLPAGRRRLPGPSAAQLVVAELVLFAVAAAVGRATWLLAVVGIAAAGTLLVLFGRRRNRWWFQHGRLRWAFRRWGRRAAVPAADPRLAALHEVAPDLTVTDVTDRAGHFGIAHDGTGWYSVVEVCPPPGTAPRPGASGAEALPGPALPLRRLAELLDPAGGDAGTVSRLSVVGHGVPAPPARLTTWAPAAASYRDVAAKLSGPVPPGESRTWVTVRLDAADAVDAAGTRGGGLTGVQRALSAALGRVGRVLAGAGLTHRLLSADELLDALTCSLGLGPPPATPDSAAQSRTTHRWDHLAADGYQQVCFQIDGWPPHAARLTQALAGLPAAWTDLAMVLGPRTGTEDPGEVRLRGYLRLAAAPDALGPACEELSRTAGLQAVRLRRLDGEHGPAAYASSPTGGGL